MRFQISSFFCWDLATGAKIIGSLGLLKHSLTFLMLYRESIDLWFNSDQFSTIVTTLYAFFLFVSFVVNVLNIIVSYRLFKILETNKIQDLTDWINAQRLYLFLFSIYFVIKVLDGDFDYKPFARLSVFIFDVYCYLCVMSIREDYRQRASLLGGSQA